MCVLASVVKRDKVKLWDQLHSNRGANDQSKPFFSVVYPLKVIQTKSQTKNDKEALKVRTNLPENLESVTLYVPEGKVIESLVTFEEFLPKQVKKKSIHAIIDERRGHRYDLDELQIKFMGWTVLKPLYIMEAFFNLQRSCSDRNKIESYVCFSLILNIWIYARSNLCQSISTSFGI